MILASRKGVSAVIATVLLIVLTIAAVAIIAGVVIPFVKTQLDKSKKCFEAIDQISIEQGEFTCYNSTNTKIMIRRGTNAEFELKGLIVSLVKSDASSEVYKIYNNISIQGVKMYSGSFDLEIPQEGGAETYVFPVSSSYASVAPILSNDETCKEISENIEAC